MFYGMYREIRDSAWQCLLDFQIDRLPVNVAQIAAQTDICLLNDTTARQLRCYEHGRSFFDGTHWIIVYNDRHSEETSRYTIAHELGHIFLGHELQYCCRTHVYYFPNTPLAERQADRFALRLLCPACILAALNLYQAEDITRYCHVMPSLAARRAKRMRQLCRQEYFLNTPLEQRVYEQFRPYVKAALCREKRFFSPPRQTFVMPPSFFHLSSGGHHDVPYAATN